ncbi:MAG: hypothetical protein AB1679_14240 [Actinomycetota bacterium]|jgi:hypothetical protein
MPALRSIRLTVVAVSLVALTAACTSGNERASLSGGVDEPAIAESPNSEPTTATTTVTLGQLVLAPDGLGPVSFGTQAARAMNGLTQALGRAEHVSHVPAEAHCEGTRIFRWKDLDVVVNEVGGFSGGKPGLVGWSLGSDGASALGLKTEKGIGPGSTVAAVKAAYGSGVTIAEGGSGPVVTITAPNGVITGALDGVSDASKVKTLRAGESCAA